jgi:hypothetical protein
VGGRIARAGAVCAALAFWASALAHASELPQQIAADPFTNATSQHETAVEPDTFAYGGTIVSAFQLGRFTNGGASGIGFATSSDGGKSWTSGTLPALTVFSTPAGSFHRGTDPSVAYDAVHGWWLVSVLVLVEPCTPSCTSAIVVSRSKDGLSWSAPVTVSPSFGSFAHDKNWTVCDNGASSPFAGRCYTSWTDFSNGARIVTSMSLDGGANWGDPTFSSDPNAVGGGAQPVVQPDGTLVIPFVFWSESVLELRAIRSTDGGVIFGPAHVISWAAVHIPTAMRAPPLPSVEVDAAGKIYAAWYDCRFRSLCGGPDPPNDIVYSTSLDGIIWTSPERVPIDVVTSGVDHFIPGLAVDPQTQGTSTRLALTYYFFSTTPCSFETCALNVGFVSNTNGTWSSGRQLNTQPMAISSIPDTTGGRMVGDYISTSFVGSTAVAVFPLSTPFDGKFHQSMHGAAIPVIPPQPPAAPPAQPSAPPSIPSVNPIPPHGVPPGLPPRHLLSLSQPRLSPATARAGQRLTVTVRLRRAERRSLAAAGEVACTARIGSRSLRVVRKQLTNARASCTWRLPRWSAGRRLIGTIRVGQGGGIASRRFAVRVR